MTLRLPPRRVHVSAIALVVALPLSCSRSDQDGEVTDAQGCRTIVLPEPVEASISWMTTTIDYATTTTTTTTTGSPPCDRDLVCDDDEDATNCLEDCGQCDSSGTCDPDETPYSCPQDCPATSCNSDGVVNPLAEQCDDGVETAQCDMDCSLPACGDGHANEAAGEACDDGNDDDGDACLTSCKIAVCGDGHTRNGTEECDEGDLNSDDTGPCRSDCTLCECQGDDLRGKACADLGFTCGQLSCRGCDFNTSECIEKPRPAMSGPPGPDFSADGCWLPCAGYLDEPGGDDIPLAWGNDCANVAFSRLRVACGVGVDEYRVITVDKNVFLEGLAGYPESDLISSAVDQSGTPFPYMGNTLYAQGNHPNNGASWWGGGNGCGDSYRNLVVNSNCEWEAANCFGQKIDGARYLWVYVSP
jgi:cysteine-rich repeat protein